jgi:hypothetical protein
MTQRRGLAAVGRFLIFVALLDLFILVVIGLVCWFGGWRTAADYANGLTYAGLAVAAIGGMRYFGGLTSTANPNAGYHSTNLGEHLAWVRRASGESDSAFVVMLKLAAAGFVALALGQLLLAAVR